MGMTRPTTRLGFSAQHIREGSEAIQFELSRTTPSGTEVTTVGRAWSPLDIVPSRIRSRQAAVRKEREIVEFLGRFRQELVVADRLRHRSGRPASGLSPK